MKTVFDTQITSLPLLHKGKVRDIYAIDDDHMLIITTDRISAFDVILPTPISGKGAILTTLSNFWFERTRKIIPNHLAEMRLEQALPDPAEREPIRDHAMVVRRLQPLPVEAIVRGYIIGSGWKDYQRSGAVCGIDLPPGLELAQRLPQPLYTPSTKAAVGDHDENVDFDHTVNLLGRERAEQIRDASLQLYQEAANFALERGIIIADTKFEFGQDESGNLILIDEVLTPDSSRFWPADQYQPGHNPPSFDKQYVRDYLEELDWDKRPPGPVLPQQVVEQTVAKYREAMERLTAA